MSSRDAAEKLEQAIELADLAERMLIERLRREHPGASPEELEKLIDCWFESRPGAEHGDAVGRPISLERFA